MLHNMVNCCDSLFANISRNAAHGRLSKFEAGEVDFSFLFAEAELFEEGGEFHSLTLY